MTTVKRQRPTPEQVVCRLREGERMLKAGKDLVEVLRHLGIAASTWRHAGGTSTAG
jgi:putative transposase